MNGSTSVYDALLQETNAAGIPIQYVAPVVLNESGGNPFSVGDNGTSFGLFQLHWGGAGTVNGVNLPANVLQDPTSSPDINQINRYASAYQGLVASGQATPANILAAETAIQAPLNQGAYLNNLLGIYNSSPDHGVGQLNRIASGYTIAQVENGVNPGSNPSGVFPNGSTGEGDNSSGLPWWGANIPILGGIGDWLATQQPMVGTGDQTQKPIFGGLGNNPIYNFGSGQGNDPLKNAPNLPGVSQAMSVMIGIIVILVIILLLKR